MGLSSNSEPNVWGPKHHSQRWPPLHVSRNFSPASAGLFVRGGADQGARLAKVVPAMKVAAGSVMRRTNLIFSPPPPCVRSATAERG
jgi:hypothetical protein